MIEQIPTVLWYTSARIGEEMKDIPLAAKNEAFTYSTPAIGHHSLYHSTYKCVAMVNIPVEPLVKRQRPDRCFKREVPDVFAGRCGVC